MTLRCLEIARTLLGDFKRILASLHCRGVLPGQLVSALFWVSRLKAV